MNDYNEAIRLNPTFAMAYNRRAIAWDNKKEYEKAINDFNEAIRLDPTLHLPTTTEDIPGATRRSTTRGLLTTPNASGSIPSIPWPTTTWHGSGQPVPTKVFETAGRLSILPTKPAT